MVGAMLGILPTAAPKASGLLGRIIPLLPANCRIIRPNLVRAMKCALSILLISIAASLALAAADTEFERLSALAAKKYTRPTPGGSEYAAKFSDWSTKPMLHAMDVCAGRASNLYCDIITVIGADGHVRRVLFAPKNSYAACVQKNLQLGAVAPKPPGGDDWPVQIRLIDGPRPNYKGGDKPFIILSAGHVP